ncbi:DNA repair protein RecO [Salegentibacter sp. F188]|uniref:DNA repair protein RecO n=1 Tax=Autumnicola patrickiae TaxID=3075591 RepID=A0ABU3E3A7_9FLAO|nr:DNA repair protein RecO [Salegentibacter sp. F188]MDT0689742.1 DNA repair protein RecO [Salegentibacter sp. F188]
MHVNTEAIVISALKYGEADLIVKAYTLESGLKTYILRGILKSKKGKLKTSLFQLLTQLDLVASHKNKGTLEYLKEAKVLHTYQTLHTNVIKTSMVIFLAEVLKNSIREEEANPPLYEYLKASLNWLDLHDSIANFHLLFLLKLSRYLGFQPDDSNKDFPYFNMLDGVFQEYKSNEYCIEGENLEILRQFLGINFDSLTSIKLNQTSRTNFLNMLILYYELHIEGFRKPKSLAVLNEIFS